MSLSHSLIDQWVEATVKAHHGDFGVSPDDREPSAAFALLVARIVLDQSDPELLPYLTDGEDDLGIDLFYVHDPDPRAFELPVTLFSAKYGTGGNREKRAFPANELVKLVSAIQTLFDPNQAAAGNERLRARAAEVHGFLLEGYEPVIRVVACSTGVGWEANGQAVIDGAGLEQVTWEHVGPSDLLAMRRGPKDITAKLPLVGPVMKEGFGFHTSLVGRITIQSVHDLIAEHGEGLIDRNVRRYLGGRNRVNREIARTLRDPEERKDLFFLNNGLTFTCSKLSHNQIQTANHVLRAEGLQLINGAQTAFTIHRVLHGMADADLGGASVLVRIYELQEDEDPELVSRIIRATNSQSPVEMHDLRANDPIQRDLELALKERGWTYLRQQRANGDAAKSITPTEAAAAVLAVWRRAPHLARFNRTQHFGSLYKRIFTASLTADQVIQAVLAVRGAGTTEMGLAASDRLGKAMVHNARFHVAMRAVELDRRLEPGVYTPATLRHVIALNRLGPVPTTAAGFSATHRRADLSVPLDVLRADLTAALAATERTPYQTHIVDWASAAKLEPA